MGLDINGSSANLDRKVTLSRPVITKNEYNEEIATYSAYATVWCEIKWQTGKERFQEDVEQTIQQAVFKMRYYDAKDVSSEDIITYENYNYNLDAPVELGYHDMIEIRGVRQVR